MRKAVSYEELFKIAQQMHELLAKLSPQQKNLVLSLVGNMIACGDETK